MHENAIGVGGWGGTCQCPDGNTYQVADNNDACMTLACTNGEMLSCNKEVRTEWNKRKVTCAGNY